MTPWVVNEVSSAESIPHHVDDTGLDKNTSTGFTSDEVIKMLSSIQKEKSHQFYSDLINVIPSFDPSSKTQSVDNWIKKINECSSIYNWNEKQTIHFAMQKLSGVGKIWYEALPTVVHTWEEWQIKLRKAFPSGQNYGQLLEEMLARTTRYGENLRDYYYDKLTLMNRCEIYGKKAVDCIIHGITDKSIRNGAQALSCLEPDDLLNFLNSQKPLQAPFVKNCDSALKQNS